VNITLYTLAIVISSLNAKELTSASNVASDRSDSGNTISPPTQFYHLRKTVDADRFNNLINTGYTPWDSTISFDEKNPFSTGNTTIMPMVYCRRGICHIAMQIASNSASPLYDKEREFTAFCDNATMEFETPDYKGDPIRDGFKSESVFIKFSSGQISLLGKCKELKLELGNSEFIIPFNKRGGWRLLSQAFD